MVDSPAGSLPLTPMSDPVDDVHAAARVLREMTGNLSGVEQSTWVAHQHEAKGDWEATTHTVYTVRNASDVNVVIANSGQLATFIATMNPALALALAAWLEDEAVGAQTPSGDPTAHAVAVARTINAAAHPNPNDGG